MTTNFGLIVAFWLLLSILCGQAENIAEPSAEVEREKRALDLGLLVRNLLLKSAAASDVKADISRNVANLKTTTTTTRRPRTRRPSTAAPVPLITFPKKSYIFPFDLSFGAPKSLYAQPNVPAGGRGGGVAAVPSRPVSNGNANYVRGNAAGFYPNAGFSFGFDNNGNGFNYNGNGFNNYTYFDYDYFNQNAAVPQRARQQQQRQQTRRRRPTSTTTSTTAAPAPPAQPEPDYYGDYDYADLPATTPVAMPSAPKQRARPRGRTQAQRVLPPAAQTQQQNAQAMRNRLIYQYAARDGKIANLVNNCRNIGFSFGLCRYLYE